MSRQIFGRSKSTNTGGMTIPISFHFLLFLTGWCDCTLDMTTPSSLLCNDKQYSHISVNHTCVKYPNETLGVKCVNLEHELIDEKDIETILTWHNVHRNTVANGLELRGDPGPQRPAKFMLELVWDDELACIARRWALQCNLFEKDQCRDVERFKVWQNVHLLDMNSVGNSTSAARLHFHIQSWYDEVEGFDSAEFGYVNYTARDNLSYISFASATISRVGCGRVIYTAGPDESIRRRRREFEMGLHTIPVGLGDRVEALVCNYGPLDRKTPGILYEDGAPALCPPRTTRSLRYGALCRNTSDSSQVHAWKNPPWTTLTSGSSQIKRTIYLGPSILLLLTRPST